MTSHVVRAPRCGAAIAGTIALVAGVLPLHAGPPQYSLAEVTPRPLRLWFAYDLGPQGQVVGRTYDLNVNPPLSRGFIWQDGVMTLLDGPNGETVTEARCIDDNGVIYGGYADRRFGLQFLKMNPVRWVDGTPIPYPDNQQRNSSTIFAASPTTGVAVGWSKPFVPGAQGWRGEYGYANELDFGTSDPVRAFRWNADGGEMLTRLLGSHDDLAVDINDAGQAAIELGSFELGGAAIFDPRLGVVRLSGLGGNSDWTRTFAINESGQIVGYSQAAGAVEHPVRWDHGEVTDLGLLPGFVEGEALDINDAGTMVGGLSTQNFPYGVRASAGFVVVDGTMHNLNDSLPSGAGFVVGEAIAINNAGQILVTTEPVPVATARFAVLSPAR